MSDERNQDESEPMRDQSPPGTPWPEPNIVTESDDGPEPIGNYRREGRQ
jgi:hypothetical protein